MCRVASAPNPVEMPYAGVGAGGERLDRRAGPLDRRDRVVGELDAGAVAGDRDHLVEGRAGRSRRSPGRRSGHGLGPLLMPRVALRAGHPPRDGPRTTCCLGSETRRTIRRHGDQVPAATRALRVLRFLAGQPDPVALDRLATAVRPAPLHGLPPARRDDRGGLRRPPRPTSTATASASRPSRSAPATPARSRCSGSPAATSPRSSTASARPRTSRCCTAATCSTSWRSALPGGRRWSPTSACGCRPT